MKPLWRLQGLSVFCILAGSALTLAGPLVLKWLIDKVLAEGRSSLLLIGTVLYGVTTAGQLAFSYAGYLVGYSAVEKLVFRIKMGRLRRLQNTSARYFEN
ncbi:MAG: ABC transporter transmembrane domain-containing protein, partial [Candidatus Angelobacter sp.]